VKAIYPTSGFLYLHFLFESIIIEKLIKNTPAVSDAIFIAGFTDRYK